MAGFATRPSFAGHTGRSAKTNYELTSNPDHQMGAGQWHDEYFLHPMPLGVRRRRDYNLFG
jgi:hypothetical protein